MRIALITGTRRSTRKGAAWSYLEKASPDAVLEGGAPGVDTEAGAWARERGRFLIEVPAPWKAQNQRADGRSYDPSAGNRRNAFMVMLAEALRTQGHEVSAAAFPDAQSIGTVDCIRRLKRANIHVEEL